MVVSYFFVEQSTLEHVSTIMYPDKETVEKCAMLHDTDTEALLKMWSRVKGANASAFTYVIITLVLGGLIAAVILKYTRRYRKRRRF